MEQDFIIKERRFGRSLDASTEHYAMTIYEFLDLVKLNPDKWIHYCEIIIGPFGQIYLAKPSHVECCLAYGMEKESKTREEIDNEIPLDCLPIEWLVDKYGLVACWYTGYMYSSYKKAPNRFQRKTINLLIQNKLILAKDEAYVRPATEYRNYLERKKLGLYDNYDKKVEIEKAKESIKNLDKIFEM